MSEAKPTAAVSRRDDGLALADALLQSNRRFLPLPAAAHDRVKCRLRARLCAPGAEPARWLRPVVVAGSLLLWGTAFGIAIDHFVFEHRLPASPPAQPAAAPESPRLRVGKSKTSAAKELIVEAPYVAPPEEPVHHDGIVAPTMPVSSAAALPPPVASLGRRPSRVLVPAARPVPTPIAFFAPSSVVSPPAKEPSIDRSPLSNTTVWPAWPAPLPDAAARVTARPVMVGAAPLALSRQPEKPAIDETGLSEERLLAAAVRALRAQQDAASALLALDAYRSRYPQGRMFVEATVLRVDALTALHRQAEALRSLDALDLSHLPGGLERRLQRGELRLASGRSGEALADFDGVLTQTREQELIERALAGHAQTRQQLGDLAGARSDAAEYLRRFPAGPFVRQALDIAQPGSP